MSHTQGPRPAGATGRRTFLQQGLSAVALSSAACEPARRAAVAPRADKEKGGGGRQKVIVIGAGLAGLSAAYELVAAGHDVTVLEAQGRPGGRVQTIRGRLEDDDFINPGAMAVPDNHELSMHYARTLGVEFDEPPPRPAGARHLSAVCYMRGRRLVEPFGKAVEWPAGLREDERGRPREELWGRYVGDAIKDIKREELDGAPAARLMPLDAVSFADFMRGRGASDEAIAVLRSGGIDHAGAGVDRTSALYGIRDLVHRVGNKNRYTVRGGIDKFPAAFAARLGGRVRYNAPVVALAQDRAGARVTWLDRGAPATFSADRVICAIPFTLLRRINISPAFSAGKRRAVEGLRYSPVVRVWVQCETKFWEDEGLSGRAMTDLPIMSVFRHEGVRPGQRGLIECYTGKEHGERLGAMGEEERAAAVMADLTRVHPAIGRFAGRVVSKCWQHDEWARGAYAWFAPGEMASFGPHLASVEGRIHFAGEHTSAWPGWMQGALSSGVRAAREVDAAARHAAG